MIRAKPWRRPMRPREHSEGHRQASWLELLFDLSFVVAVAQAARQFEHALAEGHPGEGLVSYLLVFAAIWWAWMAFTWFANVFDVDDVPYRLLMLVMIAGSLGLAAGVPQLAHLDFRIGVISYVVMRFAYVAQWLRVAATGDSHWRPVAIRMAALTVVSQIGWVLFLWVPMEWRVPVFLVWFAVDIATPVLAGWDARAGGHSGHIVERYGLFTLIVLGESIAAATVAIGEAIDVGLATLPLLVLAAGGLIVAFALWWIYFEFSSSRATTRGRVAQFVWGYGHYFLFAAAAAVGAGLALGVQWVTDREHVVLPAAGVALVVGAAVAVYLLTIAAIESLAEGGEPHLWTKVGSAAAALGLAFAAPVLTVPGSVLAIGVLLATLVAYGVILEHRLHLRAPA